MLDSINLVIPVVYGGPEPGSHVDGVSGGQLELDSVDLEAEGDGVEKSLLRLFPELQHCREDVVSLQLLRGGLAASGHHRMSTCTQKQK